MIINLKPLVCLPATLLGYPFTPWFNFSTLTLFYLFRLFGLRLSLLTNTTKYTPKPLLTYTVRTFFFLSTKRYSFSSALFFFLFRTPQLPSFFSTRFFTSRYRVFGFRFRRFGLQLPATLVRNRALLSLIYSSRIGNRVGTALSHFRRNTRFFFFRRRLTTHLGLVQNKKYSYPIPPHSLILPTRALVSSQPWTFSWFTSVPAQLGLNLVPFFFIASYDHYLSGFASVWLLEFRRQATRFLRIDFKRTVIKYNLKPILFRDSWVMGNRAMLWTPSEAWRLHRLGFKTYRLKKNTPLVNLVQRLRYPLEARKATLFRLRTRRMPVAWVSKITQRTLTPARREFNYLYFKKPLRYQHRLTVLVTRYYRFRVLEYLTLVEFSLLNAVMRSRLIVLYRVAMSFIFKGWLTVNGLVLSDPTYLVAPLDLLQLIPTTRWLVFYKWYLLKIRETFGRFFFYLRKWRLRARRPYPKQSSFRIPDWVRRRLYFRETTPIYFELDFLTFSCINLINPLQHFNNFHFLSINRTASATIRPLNWKSLT